MHLWLDRFKALADETRMLLLAALLEDELSVGELAEVISAGQTSVSRHLAALRDAGLVVGRKQGTASFYRLAGDDALLDGPLAQPLIQFAKDRRLAPRIEKVLARRREKSRAFFAQADDWDGLRKQLFAAHAGLACLVPLLPTKLVVADIGTGTGGMLEHLAAIAEEIIAVDVAPEMLARASAKAKRLGLDGVSFRQGELSQLPIESESVDAAFATLVLHHAPRPVEALREMGRILKPGGSLVVADLVSHGHEWLKEEQADIWLGFEKTELERLLEKAGLEVTSYRVVSQVEVSRKGSPKPLELFVASGRRSECAPQSTWPSATENSLECPSSEALSN